MQLLEQGLTIEQIAASLRLPVPRTKRYIEEEETARDLARYQCDQIPAARIRELYRQRQGEDPTLSKTTIARAADLDRGVVSGALGHAPEAGDAESERQDDRVLVSVDVAARIVRALGFAPHEVDGL
jgi:hypothetical protein